MTDLIAYSVGILIFKGFWLIMIFGTINYVIHMQIRAKPLIEYDPSLAKGYRQYFRVYLALGAIPWLVMGIGIIFGNVPTFLSFFSPKNGGPFVLLFHFILICYWLYSILWIYVWNGAEFVFDYLLPLDDRYYWFHPKSVLGVKIRAAIGSLSWLLAMTMMWTVFYDPNF